MTDFIVTWLAGIPAYATPLLFAALGFIVAERAGVLNLGAEGFMAVGAMAGAGVTLATGSTLWGVLAAAGAGATLAIAFGVVAVVLRADQVLAGLATVAVGLGLAGVLGRDFVHETFEGLAPLDLPGLASIPGLGPILFRQDALVYLAVATAVVLHRVFAHTLVGLRLRAIGEDPAAADAAGVHVQWHQLAAVTVAGALCGLGGASLSVAGSDVWVEGMVAGRGWIALALTVLARWQPVRAIGGAVLFGGVDALLPRMLADGVDLPVYLANMLPYALTIAVLVVAQWLPGRRSAEPAALGLAYLRQDRR